MGIFKRHNELKKRYEELSNNYELLVKRNKNLYDRDIEHQKKYKEKIHELKVENAKLKLELEDTRGFLKQERDAKEELLRQIYFFYQLLNQSIFLPAIYHILF